MVYFSHCSTTHYLFFPLKLRGFQPRHDDVKGYLGNISFFPAFYIVPVIIFPPLKPPPHPCLAFTTLRRLPQSCSQF